MSIRDRWSLVAAAVALGACQSRLETTTPPAVPGHRVLVETRAAGWTRIPAADLIAAGIPGDVPVSAVGVTHRGATIGCRFELGGALLEDAGALELWAEAPESYWTDSAFYEIGTDRTPCSMETRDLAEDEPGEGVLRVRARTAPEKFYILSMRNGPATNFVWDGIVAVSAAASKTFTVRATRPRNDAPFRMELELYGLTTYEVEPDHHVVVEVNGNAAAEATFDGLAPHVLAFEGPGSWLVAGDNVVTLRLPHDTGATRDSVVLRAITLDYGRNAAVSFPVEPLVASLDRPGRYAIDEMHPSTRVYDVTDPLHPIALRSAAAQSLPDDGGDDDDDGEESPAGPFTFALDTRPGYARTLALVPPQSARTPAAVRAPRLTAPALPWEGAELLIVTPASLRDAADRLAAHRESQGITVAVFDFADVADAFGGGYAEPQAIAALVRFAQDNATIEPRWLLLFGDASHDPKERLSDQPGGELLPTVFDDSALMESPTDNAMVAATARSAPTLAVGRVPAASPGEADAFVDKLIAYDAASTVSNKVVLTADNATATWEFQLFEQTSDILAGELGQDLDARKIYVGMLGASGARDALEAELAEGALWVNYLGHGTYTEWASERIFQDDDVAVLPEQEALPVYVVMNCLTGYFAQPNWKLRSLAEQLVVAPEKGAVAVIASSALAYPGGQPELDLALAQQLLVDRDVTIGEALRNAKAILDAEDPEQSDVILSWHLLGDPSMRLRTP